MSSSFQNPRNPLAAMWASAVETHLREQNPDLRIQQIRQLPMMQGLYSHLSQLKKKLRVVKPPTQTAAKESDQSTEIAKMAYLSQTFFDLAITTAAVSQKENTAYEDYIAMLEIYNELAGITDFSTKDKGGFGLCLIIWIGLTGLNNLGHYERKFLDALINTLNLSNDTTNRINDLWDQMAISDFKNQYRDAADYPDYKEITWKIPSDAKIVMLGDWGTSMDDAHQFLKAIWREACGNKPDKTIVFIHLGDIYYCGLPYECENYFRQVFINVGQELLEELKNGFNPNPPIFTIPGNHEYYSYGQGYFRLLDNLNQNVPKLSHADLYQQCSFFCLRTEDYKWQFLGMDTGQADGNALLSLLQALGGMANEKLEQVMPDGRASEFLKDLIVTTYEDHAGPFQPTLRENELKWLEARFDKFDGKTIMLSHHQLFSRQAEINHDTPQYLNTWLDKRFSPYYKNQIAAWFWGHEHSLAVYMDGLMGLNKGRLLGSSSYEATKDEDSPYDINYAAIPWSNKMTKELVKKNGKLYYHVGAILSQSGDNMAVKYYQFPAWTQLEQAPNDLQLKRITAIDEEIKPKFTSLKPSWIGNKPIKQNDVTADHSPAITTWKDKLYVLYVNGSESRTLRICTADATAYRPEDKNAELVWSGPIEVKVNGNSILTKNSPAIIAADGKLFGFYRDSNKKLQGISMPIAGNFDTWTTIGCLDVNVDDAAPAVCFFGNRIYIVYRKNGNNELGWAYYDLKGKWCNLESLNDDKGDAFRSDTAPALGVDPYRIYMTYQIAGGSDICWAFGDPSELTDDKTISKISWTNKGKVESRGKDGKDKDTTNPDTSIGMTLQCANGVFLMVYTSTNESKDLTQCALNDIGKESTGEWIGSNTVKVRTGDKITTAQSSAAPALAIITGGGVLVYRGLNSEALYWAYY